MQWSVITWRSANPIQDTGGTAEAVHPVFSRTLPQALPEASSGVSPSHILHYRSLL